MEFDPAPFHINVLKYDLYGTTVLSIYLTRMQSLHRQHDFCVG